MLTVDSIKVMHNPASLKKKSRNNKGQIMSWMKQKLTPEKELDTSNIVKLSRSESCGK